MRPRQPLPLLPAAALAGIVGSVTLGLGQKVASDKFYRIVDGKVDERTYNGFRRYNARCNHCHGPDGVGSTCAASTPSCSSRRTNLPRTAPTSRQHPWLRSVAK
jgi:hypothetical protein